MEKSKVLSMADANARQWIMWTNVFYIADGIIHTIYVNQKKKGGRAFLEALQDIHIALKNVDKSFVDVADALNKGEKIPPITLPAIEIVDWDDKSTMGEGIIEILSGAVNLIIESIQGFTKSVPLDMVLRALGGLLNAFDEYKRVKAAANTIFPDVL